MSSNDYAYLSSENAELIYSNEYLEDENTHLDNENIDLKKIIKKIQAEKIELEYEYDELKNQCMIHNGMIPKLDNAFLALNSGVNTIFLTSPDSLKSNCMVIKGTRIIS